MGCSDFCGIHNIVQKTYFEEEYYRVIINNIWFETTNEENLDVDLYLTTANFFIKTLDENMLADTSNIDVEEIYNGFVDSLYDFSAAKQYQFIRECNSVSRENFSIFYDLCKDVFIKYYERFMSIEDDMVEQQAKSAINWVKITS